LEKKQEIYLLKINSIRINGITTTGGNRHAKQTLFSKFFI